jgi:hypothetical protein
MKNENLKCPVCGGNDYHNDIDGGDDSEMKCCDICGSDFLPDGEVLLNGRTVDRPEEYRTYSNDEISKGNTPMDFYEWELSTAKTNSHE